MILFQAEDYQIDLSLYGINLNEESNMFVDSLIKSYSFPFSLPLAQELAVALGFPSLENMKSTTSNITGTLVVDDIYFDASLTMGDVVENTIEVTLYYGEENLAIYDSELSALPWPLQLVTDSATLANNYLDKSWPDVPHNYPLIYRPDIKQENDYADFELFVNNYDGTDFVQNTAELVDNLQVYKNKNVLSPCVYMLEILSFIYEQAGKKIRGAVIEDERLKNLIYIPDNYIETFKGSVYQEFQFDKSTATESLTLDVLGGLNSGIFIQNLNIGLYQRTFTPDNIGTYKIKFNINFDSVVASYFDLLVYQVAPGTLEKTYFYTSNSKFNRVSISQELDIEITTENQFDEIFIELRIPYTTESISELNSFEYSFSNGRLNELTSSYSLAEFMPDMTAGEYVNHIKNWLNLDISFNEEYVYIDFVQDVLEDLPKADHSHLEVKSHLKSFNNNRTFRLEYADETVAIVDSSGQIYSDLDKEDKDIITIEMGVQMAVVESNYDRSTAIYPEEEALTFTLYNGLTGTKNKAQNTIEDFNGSVDNIYQLFWSSWLATRTNNITIKDIFKAHQSELLTVRSKIFKYNEILIPKIIRKTRDSHEYWEVEIEAESI